MIRNYPSVLQQLALEFHTVPEAFTTPGLTITLPAKPKGVRLFSREVPFFLMAGTGNSVVVSADERMHGFVRSLSGEVNGLHRLFEFPALTKINEEVKKYGHQVWGTEHMFLPGRRLIRIPLPDRFSYRWYESEEEISSFYPNTQFPMALHPAYHPDRPDVIALAALDGGKIAGLAGASADTAEMWQVGIDVLPQYRGKGLGAALVSALSLRIQEKGHLPYYGSAVANLHSQAVAVRCGYVPAWVETEA